MRVLVPFDLTPVSERAVKFALEEYADDPSAEIYAVHFNKTKHGTVEDIINRTVEEFAEEKEFTEGELVVEVEKRDENVDESSTAGDLILQYLQEHDVDHIVMGQHNRPWYKNIIKDSASEKVTDESSVPVTLVP